MCKETVSPLPSLRSGAPSPGNAPSAGKTRAAERPKKGLLLNITGDGKGKTTSAVGMVARSLGWGHRVAFLQFIKNEFDTGEKLFLERLNDPNFFMAQLGCGFSYRPGDHRKMARDGWELAKQYLSGERYADLLVLDELNIALGLGYLEEEEVVDALLGRRPGLSVVVTGRGAKKRLREISDLVSEVNEIKHPYRSGIAARKGIDY